MTHSTSGLSSRNVSSRPGAFVDGLRQRPLFAKAVLACLFPGLVLWSPVRANPTGGVVVHGNVSMSGGAGNLTINQGSRNAIINWADFSIDAGELTRFVQPGSNAAVLNRVTGGNPSAIHGALQANGSVFLINPNGILVGPGGTIDVHGLVLSTLDVKNGEFLAGGDMVFKGDSSAGVTNYGRINGIGGDVFLMARNVANHGSISAGGTVGLGAGQEVLITAGEGARGERMLVRAGGGGGVGVLNDGTIEGAAVELKAHGNAYALGINNKGSVRATGVSQSGGRVFLRSEASSLSHSGSIEARAPNGGASARVLIEAAYARVDGRIRAEGGSIRVAGGERAEIGGELDVSSDTARGGSIAIEGGHVELGSQSRLDASGLSGGTVLIGGGFQGRDQTIGNALETTVELGSAILADGFGTWDGEGDAGLVVVWADGDTLFSGEISAQGTARGGFVEVSGKNRLGFDGVVSTLAADGTAGTLLLDPRNGIISTGVHAPGDSPFVINRNTLQSALGSNHVIVSTFDTSSTDEGHISVRDSVIWNSNFGLTLLAEGDIYVGDSIVSRGAGEVNLVAGWNPDVAPLGVADGSAYLPGPGSSIDMAAQVFGVPGAFGHNGGSVYVGSVDAPGTSADRRVMVASRAGATNVAGYNVNVWAAPLDTVNNNPQKSAQIGYNRQVSAALGPITGEIRVEAVNDVSLVSNRYAVGADGYPGWGNSPGTGEGGLGYNAYAQIGHGGRDVVRNPTTGPTELAGDITVIAGRDVTGTGGKNRENYVLIGHGGFDNKRLTEDPSVVIGESEIRVEAGRDLVFQAGTGSVAYAQIGHGGNAIDLLSFAENAIHVDVGGNLVLGGGVGAVVSTSTTNYAMLGHGGYDSDGDATSGETYRGEIVVRVGGSATLVGGDRANSFAQIGHGGALADGGHSGDITLTVEGGGIELRGGTATSSYAQIGHGGDRSTGSFEGDIRVASTGGVLARGGGSGAQTYAQIGHGGYQANQNGSGLYGGSIMVEAAGVSLVGGNGNYAYAHIGHGGALSFGEQTGEILVSAEEEGIELLGGAGTGTYGQIGHGGARYVGDSSGAVRVVSGGDIAAAGGTGDTANVQIGHGGRSTTTSAPSAIGPADIEVEAAGDILLHGGPRSYAGARIGHGGQQAALSSFAESSITVKAGRHIELHGPSFDVHTAVSYSSAHIGHGGVQSPVDGGDSGYRGDITVEAGGKLDIHAARNARSYNYAFIGNGAYFQTPGVHSGDITVRTGLVEGLDAYGISIVAASGDNPGAVNTSTSYYSFAGIGHRGHNPGIDLSGDILVDAVRGGISLTGGTGTGSDGSTAGTTPPDFRLHPAQIGHGGYNITTTGIDGSIRVHAQGDILLLAESGRQSPVLIGHGGTRAKGPIGKEGDVIEVVSREGNLELRTQGTVAENTVYIGHGDAASGSGDRMGHILIDVAGEISLIDDGTPVWIGHRTNASGVISHADLTIRASALDFASGVTGNGRFHSGGDFATMMSANLAGGNVSLIATGAGGLWLSDHIRQDSPFALNLLSHGDLFLTANAINQGSGAVNLVAGWDPSVSSLAGGEPTVIGGDGHPRQYWVRGVDMHTEIFDAPGSYGAGGGSVWIGADPGLGGADRAVVVASRTGETNVAGHDVRVLGSALTGGIDAGERKFSQIGYDRREGGTGLVPATGSIRVKAANDIEVVANLHEVGALGYSGLWTGGDRTGYVSYAQIGHGGDRTSVTDLELTGDITVEAGRDLAVSGGRSRENYAQIGHGGYDNMTSTSATLGGDITVRTGRDIALSGGQGLYAYAQIGHGGTRHPIAGFVASDISVVAGGDIALTGGAGGAGGNSNGATARIGHGGFDAATQAAGAGYAGAVSVRADGSLTLIAGGGGSSYNFAQIGHGGVRSGGDHSGDISVVGGNGIVLDASAASGAFGSVQIGHGGESSPGALEGSITVVAEAGDITISGGSSTARYAQIGHGGASSGGAMANATGSIELSSSGLVRLNSGSGAEAYTLVGHGGFGSGSSANYGLAGESIVVDARAAELNAGSGTGAFSQIGHGGHRIEGAKTADIVVTTLEGVLLDGKAGKGEFAHVQIGHGGYQSGGALSGIVTVLGTGAASAVTLRGGDHLYQHAHIGHGGFQSTGAKTGAVTVAAGGGGIRLLGGGDSSDGLTNLNSYARIGHGGSSAGGAASGAISVITTSGGDILVRGGARRYTHAQIGHGGRSSTGNQIQDGAIEVKADGAISLIASYDEAKPGGSTTGTAGETFAQIGHGGMFGGGRYAGDIDVSAQTGISMRNGESNYNFSRIGHGGYDPGTGSNPASIITDADIRVSTVDGGVVLDAYQSQTYDWNLVQIGHGGIHRPGTRIGAYRGDISVDAGTGGVSVLAGRGRSSAAQIGHGGVGISGNHGGEIRVSGDGDLVMRTQAGGTGIDYRRYARIGHGGASDDPAIAMSGHLSGDICVTLGGSVLLDASLAQADASAVQIGHGGSAVKGDFDGKIVVVARGAGGISLLGGPGAGTYAQIGHGGTETDGLMTGHLDVIAETGDLTLTGGSGAAAYAMFGHGDGAGSSLGQRGGGVRLFAGGAITGTDGPGTGSGVRLFHQTGGGLTAADYLGGNGFQLVGNGGVQVSDAALNGVNTMIGGNIGSGPISLAFANEIDLLIGAGNDFAVDTDEGFYLLTGGSITMLSAYQNAGTGGVTLVAGWDGTGFSQTGSVSYALSDPGPPEVLDFCMPTISVGSAALGVDFTCASYGNHGALLTVGSDTQTSRVSVGSAGGPNAFAGAGIRLQAGDSSAGAATQLGYYGTGGAIVGAIDVRVQDQSLVMNSGAAAGAFTQIGHGGTGASVSGGVNAAIEVSFCLPSDLTLAAGAEGSYAQIGHGGVGLAGIFSGTVTVDGARDVSVVGGGAQAYAQIGHGGSSGTFGIGSSDPVFAGARSLSASGAIQVVNTSGAVTLQGGAGVENAYSQIGHGGVAIAGGGSIGDSVTVEAATGGITLQGGLGSTAHAMIGSGGYQIASPISGNVRVDATGTGVGDGVRLLGGDGLHTYAVPRSGFSGALIGNGGYATTSTVGGDTSVTVANGGLLMRGGAGYHSNATIGHSSRGGGGAMSGFIEVGVGGGDITLEAGSTEWFSFAQIGHGGWDNRSHSGNIEIVADTGDIVVRGANGATYGYAKIGHGGYSNSTTQLTNTGTVTVTATAGEVALESRGGRFAFTQIGHGGLGKGGFMRGQYHGDILVTAGRGVVLGAGGGEDTFALIGHGGTNARGIFTGAVNVHAGGEGIAMAGGSGARTYTQVGHGGYNEAGADGVYTISGANVTVEAARVAMDGGTGTHSYSMIGNGGAYITGASTGNDVTVSTTGTDADDGVKMRAGSAESAFVMIGSGTRSTAAASNPGDMDVSGTVTVTSAGGGISLEGRSTRAFALIGNGGFEVDGHFSGDTIVRSNGGTVHDGISLRGGGGQYSTATIGSSNNNAIGSIVSNTLVEIAGGGLSLDAGTGTLARAAIGLQSRFFQGDRIGDVTVSVGGGDVTLQASNGTASQAHIGSGGYGAGNGANGLISGDVSLTVSDGSLTMRGGDGGYSSYSMIGNGGSSARAGNIDGSVTVVVKDDITMSAGAGDRTYAMIGNGGTGQNGNHGAAGDAIRVVSQTGDISMSAGSGVDSFAQIGMGGATSPGAMQGEICVIAGGSIAMDASGGTGTGNYVQIGHGGRAVPGALDGKIVVVARGADGISLLGGPGTSAYAQIGHGGTGTNGLMTGHLHIIAETGDLSLGGGTGGSAYAMFGHGDGARSSLGQRGGGVHLFAQGDLIGTGGTGAAGSGNVFFFHQNNNGLQPADYLGGDGYQKVVNGSISMPAYASADESTMINGNIGVGTVAIIDNSNTDYVFDGGDTFVNSSDDFYIVTGGSITMLNSYQNAGSGSVTLVAGWNGVGSATPGSVSFNNGELCDPVISNPGIGIDFNNCESFGNGGAGVVLGSATQTSPVRVGSRGGTTTVAGYGLSLLGSNTTANASTQLGFRPDGSGAVSGAIEVHLKGGGLDLLGGNAAASFAQIGHGGTGATSAPINAPITISFCEPGDVRLLAGNGVGAYGQIGHGGNAWLGDRGGAIRLEGIGGLSLASGTTDGYTQIGHGGAAVGSVYGSGAGTGSIFVEAADHVTLAAGRGANAYSQIGHGGARQVGHFEGAVTLLSGGSIETRGGTADTTAVQIGHGGRNLTTAALSSIGPGDIRVEAADDVLLQAGTGSYSSATIGHGNHLAALSSFAESAVTVKAGRHIELVAPQFEVYTSRAYASAQIGHGGTRSGVAGGASGYSGDITVEAGGKLDIFAARNSQNFNYAFIGNGAYFQTAGNHSGDISVRTGLVEGLDAYGITIRAASGDAPGAAGNNTSYYSFAGIGHRGHNPNNNFSGDILVDALRGGISLTGGTGIVGTTVVDTPPDMRLHPAQIGHGGYNITTTGTDGSIRVHAQGDILMLTENGPTSPVLIGHGGFGAKGPIGKVGDVIEVISREGNLELRTQGTVSGNAVYIGHGDSASGNGARMGDILIDVAGEISLVQGGSPVWLGHRSNTVAGFSNADLTIRAAGLDFASGNSGNGLFHVGGTVGTMMSNNLAGGNVSLIATGGAGLWVSSMIRQDTAHSLNLLSYGDLHMSASAINQGGGDVNLVAGWDPSVSSLSDDPETAPYRGYWVRDIDMETGIFDAPGSYGNGGGSVWVGVDPDLTGAGIAVMVGSRTGRTNVAGHDVMVWAAPSETDFGHQRFAQIGYSRVVAGTGTAPISGEIRVQATNDIGLAANYYAVGVDGYTGWGNSPGPGLGGQGYNAYAQIGHGARDAVRFSELSGDITVIAGRDITGTGGKSRENFVQIGHGGFDNKRAPTVEPSSVVIGEAGIRVQAGRDLIFEAGSGSVAFAQVGHGGNAIDVVSVAENAIHVDVGGNLVFAGGTGGPDTTSQIGYAQLGHGGYDSDSDAPEGEGYRGDITVTVGGKVTLTGGDRLYNHALIGHGGALTDGGHSGTVSVSAGSGIELQGGVANFNFAMIGHGGFGIDGALSGDVIVRSSDGGVSLQGGDSEGSFARIGLGGYGIEGSFVGGTEVTAAGAIVLQGGGTTASEAQIGGGGTDSRGEKIGSILVDAGSLLLLGGGAGGFAQIGSGGFGSTGEAIGAIEARLAGAADLGGGSGQGAYALLGHGGIGGSGDGAGRLLLEAQGPVTLSGGGGVNAFAQVGHGGVSMGGAFSGDLDLSAASLALLGGGGARGYARIGHGGFGGAGSAAGSISVQSTEGDISLLGGGGAYSDAQIGHGGSNSARRVVDQGIAVDSAGSLLLQGGSGAQASALLGHGGANVTATQLSGGLELGVAGSLQVFGGSGALAFAQIGHGGASADAAIAGETTVAVGGSIEISTAHGAAGAYAKIGHGDDLDGSLAFFSGTGTRAGDLTVGAGTDIRLSDGMIGHVNASSAALAVSGVTQIGVSRDDPEDPDGGRLVADAASEFAGTEELRFYLPRRSSNGIEAGARLNGEVYAGPYAAWVAQGIDEYTIHLVDAAGRRSQPDEHGNLFGTGPAPASPAGFAFYYDTIELGVAPPPGSGRQPGGGGAGPDADGPLWDFLSMFPGDRLDDDWIRELESDYRGFHPFRIYYEGFRQYGPEGQSTFRWAFGTSVRVLVDPATSTFAVAENLPGTQEGLLADADGDEPAATETPESPASPSSPPELAGPVGPDFDDLAAFEDFVDEDEDEEEEEEEE